MHEQRLIDSARALSTGDREILALDESTPTCDELFTAAGLLSGGPPDAAASARRSTMNLRLRARPPWTLSPSFGRFRHPRSRSGGGEAQQVPAAQRARIHRARCNSAALRGEYSTVMETM